MKKFFILFFLSSFQLCAQKIYQPHEIETAAEPVGGTNYLGQFIAANLQIPFRSGLKGLNGRVFVKGVVTPEGTMQQLEITRGIDDACNAEAMRIMGLFKAWKPATVKGEKVAQVVNYPIMFKTSGKANFDSTTNALVDYFDEKFAPTANPDKFEYRTIVPVDENGFVSQDVIYEQKFAKWRNIGTAAFTKANIQYHADFQDAGFDIIPAYHISARDKNLVSHATEAIFTEDGKLVSRTEYGPDNKASIVKLYDLKGMVRVYKLYSDSLVTEMSWHPNGQLKSVIESNLMAQNDFGAKVYINAWDQNGLQQVKDGNGYWKGIEKGNEGKWIVEEGPVLSGAKNGKWVGKWVDSTLFYEEIYERNTLTKGFSFHEGQKVEYTQPKVQPQFKGGLKEFYRFLGTNIKYPTEAARRGVTGKVMMSFVVCEDGTLCDYKVENKLGYGLEDEAMRVVKKMSGMWQPGELRGKTVRVKYNLPINFQM